MVVVGKEDSSKWKSYQEDRIMDWVPAKRLRERHAPREAELNEANL
jgi:hypothetical protein